MGEEKKVGEKDYVSLITPSERKERISEITVCVTYCWRLADGRVILLYLHFTRTRLRNQDVLVLHTNFDSSDVRGQGRALWNFMKKVVQKFRNNGLEDFQPCTILHEVQPNEYSTHLPKEDESYIEKDGKYYCLY